MSVCVCVCLRVVLGISSRQQWDHHITSHASRQHWGDLEPLSRRVTKRRLEWLGHVARMPDHRIPKADAVWMASSASPTWRTEEKMEDLIRTDLRAVDVPEDSWYEEATVSRANWRATHQLGMEEETARELDTDPPPSSM